MKINIIVQKGAKHTQRSDEDFDLVLMLTLTHFKGQKEKIRRNISKMCLLSYVKRTGTQVKKYGIINTSLS